MGLMCFLPLVPSHLTEGTLVPTPAGRTQKGLPAQGSAGARVKCPLCRALGKVGCGGERDRGPSPLLGALTPGGGYPPTLPQSWGS